MVFGRYVILWFGCLLPAAIFAADQSVQQEAQVDVDDTDVDSARESLRFFLEGGDKRFISGDSGNEKEEVNIWNELNDMERAALLHENGEFAIAEKTYISVLESQDSSNEKRMQVLEELVELYADQGKLARAVYCVKAGIQNFPDLIDRPIWLFRLAELYHEMGLAQDAIGMYYRVLNSVVITGEDSLKDYLGLARRAQFEIARTHYEDEDYKRAFSLFDRIELLNINPQDRETVYYYKAVSALKGGTAEKAVESFDGFLRNYPDSEFTPEILYLKAEALFALSKPDASANALLSLLEMTTDKDKDSAKSHSWKFWKQQAGNQLANHFFVEEKYPEALRLYQGMAALDNAPSWRLPIIYQIGLCFEKLSLFHRAMESYNYIISSMDQMVDPELVENLTYLEKGARWRLDMIDWRKTIQESETEFVRNNLPEHITGDSES